MITLNVHKEVDENSSFSQDENLTPAIAFIKQWHTGVSQFSFYSSGSTGNPKEIILSRTFIIESAQRTIDLFEISPSDTLLLALNTSFMGGMMMIARALISKCKLIYIPPQSISKEALKKLPPIKLASFVPAQIANLILNDSSDTFSNINNVLLGGAPINNQLQENIYNSKSPCVFYHTYGMTETASHVALRNLTLKEHHYTALKNYSFDIDSRDCITINYSGAKDFTIQTNDIVKLITPTTFEWIGRADWVINSGGVKFNLETAENCVQNYLTKQHRNIQITSFKAADEQWGEKWVLIIENNPLSKKEEEALCEHCTSHLGKYIYPKEIRYIKKIVYLSSGKVDRFNSYTNAS